MQTRAKVAYQEHCPIGELLGPDRESQFLEYKATLRTRAETGEVQATGVGDDQDGRGFLNSRDGGTLLLGIDNGGTPVGLESDYASLRKPGKNDRDLFQLHLVNILMAAMGDAAVANVTECISGGSEGHRRPQGSVRAQDRLLHPSEQRHPRDRRSGGAPEVHCWSLDSAGSLKRDIHSSTLRA